MRYPAFILCGFLLGVFAGFCLLHWAVNVNTAPLGE